MMENLGGHFCLIFFMLGIFVQNCVAYPTLISGDKKLIDNSRCPEGFSYFEDRCYKLYTPFKDEGTGVSFEEAQRRCDALSTTEYPIKLTEPPPYTQTFSNNELISRFAGNLSHWAFLRALAVNATQGTNLAVSYTQNGERNYPSRALTWIGLTDQFEEGKWQDASRWVSGINNGVFDSDAYFQNPKVSGTYKMYPISQPNNKCLVDGIEKSPANCVVLAPYDPFNGEINSVGSRDLGWVMEWSCPDKAGNFICEAAAKKIPETYEELRCPPGMFYLASQRKCYGFGGAEEADASISYFAAQFYGAIAYPAACFWYFGGEREDYNFSMPFYPAIDETLREIHKYYRLELQPKNYNGLIGVFKEPNVNSKDVYWWEQNLDCNEDSGSLDMRCWDPDIQPPAEIWGPGEPDVKLPGSTAQGIYLSDGKVHTVNYEQGLAPSFFCEKDPYFITGRACNILLNENSSFMICDCGEYFDESSGSCLPYDGISRISMALHIAECQWSVNNNERKDEIIDRMLTCIDPLEASSTSDLMELERTLRVYYILSAFQPGDWYRNNPKWSPISDYYQDLKSQIMENGEFCSYLCECGEIKKNGNCEPASSRDEILINARKEAFCEYYQSTSYPAGTFIMHSVACASSLTDSENILSDIAIIASYSKERLLQENKFDSNSLLESAISILRALAVGGDQNQNTKRGTVPWFRSEFWEESASGGLSAVTKKVEEFKREVDKFELENNIIDDIGNTENILTQQSLQLFETLNGAADDAIAVFRAEESRTDLTVSDALTTARIAQDQLERAKNALLGDGESEKGSLDIISENLQTLIKADFDIQEKELEIERRLAVWNIIRAGANIVFGAISGGASAASKIVGAGTKAAKGFAQVSKLAKKASNLVNKGISKQTGGLSGKTIGPIQQAAEDANEKIKAVTGVDIAENIPFVGDILTIADSIKTFVDFDEKMRELAEKEKETLDGADLAIGELREMLNGLAAKAVALSLTLIAASIDSESDAIDLTSTVVDPALLEPVYLWEETEERVVRAIIEEFGICPGPDDTNPYRGGNRRILSLNDYATSVDTDKNPSFRKLGDFDTDEEREAAAVAWDELSASCVPFFRDLEDFTRWGAEANRLALQVVEAIRDKAVLQQQLNALESTSERWAESVKSLVQESADNLLRDRFARTYSRAVIYGKAMTLIRVARTTISELCASWYYSNPKQDVREIGYGVGIAEDCNIYFENSVSNPLERIEELRKVLSEDFGFVQRWRTELLSESQGENPQEILTRCDLEQSTFINDLLSEDKEAWFEILPVTLDSQVSTCLVNAEIKYFSVVFRDSYGNILPRSGPDTKAISVQLESSTASTYFKYEETENAKIQEFEFRATKPIVKTYSYISKQNDIEGCEIGFHEEVVGRDVLCVVNDDEDSDPSAISRLPPYGRWKLSISSNNRPGWPVNEPPPATAEVRLVLIRGNAASEGSPVCDGFDYDLSTDILSLRNNTLQLGVGKVCGGGDYESRIAALLTDSSSDRGAITSDMLDTGTIWLVSVGSVFLFAAAIITFRYLGKNRSFPKPSTFIPTRTPSNNVTESRSSVNPNFSHYSETL